MKVFLNYTIIVALHILSCMLKSISQSCVSFNSLHTLLIINRTADLTKSYLCQVVWGGTLCNKMKTVQFRCKTHMINFYGPFHTGKVYRVEVRNVDMITILTR